MKMSGQNKKIALGIILLIVAVGCYLYYKGAISSNKVDSTSPIQTFYGPKGGPHVIGPNSLPPAGK
jgi:hypothetical protein